MQKLIDHKWSKHLFWQIKGIGLTHYVETYKGCLNDQDISSEESEALDSQPMLKHTKVVWAIRIFLLRNKRHWTHSLCWNIQRLIKWSVQLFWEIRDTGLTSYIRICKECLSYLFWEIRGTGLTFYVGACKVWLSDQNISSKKSEAVDSHSMLKNEKMVGQSGIRTFLLSNQRHWRLDSPVMFKHHAKIMWVISISFWGNRSTK